MPPIVSTRAVPSLTVGRKQDIYLLRGVRHARRAISRGWPGGEGDVGESSLVPREVGTTIAEDQVAEAQERLYGGHR